MPPWAVVPGMSTVVHALRKFLTGILVSYWSDGSFSVAEAQQLVRQKGLWRVDPLVGGTLTSPVDPTIGALLIGTFISTGLFGIATTQTYWYYGYYPGDRKRIKALVRLHTYQSQIV